MITKFDIGEKVLVEAEVVEIKVTSNGMVTYRLTNDNWSNIERFDETEIIAMEKVKEQNK